MTSSVGTVAKPDGKKDWMVFLFAGLLWAAKLGCSGEGSEPAGPCEDLLACCNTLAQQLQSQCQATYDQYRHAQDSEKYCQQALEAMEQAGGCSNHPDGGVDGGNPQDGNTSQDNTIQDSSNSGNCPPANAEIAVAQLQNPRHPNNVHPNCPITIKKVVATTSGTSAYDQSYDFFYAQEPTSGEWGGVFVFSKKLSFSSIQRGQTLTLQGSGYDFNGRMELICTSVQQTGSAAPPVASVVLPSEVGTSGTKPSNYLGVLVEVRNVMITDAVVLGTDGKDHGDFAIASESDPTKKLIIGWQFLHSYACPNGHVASVCSGDTRLAGRRFSKIIGVLDYTYNEYRLQPRDDNDFVTAD